MTNTIQTFLNKALIVMLVASIVLTLILAREYHHAKAANARQLATAIAEARDEACELAQNKDFNTPSISSRLLLTPRPYRPRR